MFGKNKINKMGIQDSIRRNIQILQEEKKVSLTEEKIITALGVKYDNTGTNSPSENVQDAIDELFGVGSAMYTPI